MGYVAGKHWDELESDEQELQVGRAMRGVDILRQADGELEVWKKNSKFALEKVKEIMDARKQMEPEVKALLLSLPLDAQLHIGGQVFFNRKD